MKITCQSCGSKYAIADDKVLGRKVKVRCKSCGTAIVVDGTQPAIAPYDDVAEEDEATRVVQGPPNFADESAGPAAWSVNLSETDQRTMTTEDIVSGWHSGFITEDAFVWRDGMTDWVPVLEMPELYDAISAAAQPSVPPAAAPAPSAPPPAATPAAAFEHPGGAAPEAARVSGGRAQAGADLFGSVAAAGSEHDPSLAAASAAPAQHAYDAKPTGARNENSVLFSLDALKAGFGGPAGEQKAPPPRQQQGGHANLDDLMGIGGGGDQNALFGMGMNQALLTAPAPEPEPPPPPPPPSVPPPGAGAQYASIAPPPARANKLLIAVAGGAIVLVLLLGGALALTLGHHKKGKQVAKNDKTSAGNHATTDAPKSNDANKDQAKNDTKKAQDDKKAAPGKSDAGAATADAGAKVTPPKNASPEEQKRFLEAMKKKKEEEAAKKKEAANSSPPPEKHKISASFNKGAAISSLRSAAAMAASCKRPLGPTGTGRAIVTFATSGRVTSANVSGGGFGGTTVGGCVASVFRHAHIPPFSGGPVTVSKSFTIPQ